MLGLVVVREVDYRKDDVYIIFVEILSIKFEVLFEHHLPDSHIVTCLPEMPHSPVLCILEPHLIVLISRHCMIS